MQHGIDLAFNFHLHSQREVSVRDSQERRTSSTLDFLPISIYPTSGDSHQPPLLPHMMNSGSAASHGDQQQKDFLNSFFSSESSTPSSEHDHQGSRALPQDIFQGNVITSTVPHPSLMSMQQQQQQSINSSHGGMDILESMIAMQERAVQVSNNSQGVHSATPQMLLEQQVRLTQLQQLQQLQNQIFQQQVHVSFILGIFVRETQISVSTLQFVNF